MRSRSKPGTREYLTDTQCLRAENDARDKAAGRKPLGKPASQASKAEREAYWAQFPNRPVFEDIPPGPVHVARPKAAETVTDSVTDRDSNEEAAE